MITDNLMASFEIMVIGMAGIFIFMLLFWMIITALHRMFPGAEEREKKPGDVS